MPTLHLEQSSVGPNHHRVAATLTQSGQPPQTAVADFDFAVTAQDRIDMCWYLEDYLQQAADPAPKMAARIEKRMADLGTSLFRAVFQSNSDGRDLWAAVRNELNNTRVEIATEVQEATTLPWELLRDPATDVPLALRANAFVRASHRAAQRPRPPHTGDGPIRILLVICRPGGRNDVPFRSVASRIVKGLSESPSSTFQLDVLRPPTFEQLGKVLRKAKRDGKPYHVVHFDGHGAYLTVQAGKANLSDIIEGLDALTLSGARAGTHGYLLFENPTDPQNVSLLDGPSLGSLLAETDVPVLST